MTEGLTSLHDMIRASGRHPVRRGADMPLPDRLVYQLYSDKRLDIQISEAQRIIGDAFDEYDPSQWAVSVSWGKDSIVLLDIILDIAPAIDVLFVDRGLAAELPETPLVIEAWRAYRDFTLYIVRPNADIFDLYHGLGGIPGITADAPDSIIARTTLAPPADSWMKDHDKVGHFMGRRIQENERTRGKHLRYRGATHFNVKRDLWTCDPLARWSARDVWAYIVKRNLPYHPAYDLDIGVSREQARLSSWSGMANATRGRWELVKLHYPELWNYFAGEFPEVRGFV